METNESEERLSYIEKSLLSRHSLTLDLLKLVYSSIQVLMDNYVNVHQSLYEISAEEGQY